MRVFNCKLALLVTAVLGSGLVTLAEPAGQVVAVTDPAAVDWFEVDSARVRAMVSRGMRALTGTDTDAAAWGRFVTATDVVGIKVNTQAAPLQVPRAAVIDAIAAGLQAAGVAATNIVVWDLEDRDLARAGYDAGARYRVRAVKQDGAWDREQYYESELIGKLIWGDLEYGVDDDNLSGRSHLPLELTRRCTKIINLPVLQDHKDYGIAGCLVNITVDALDNNRRFGFGNQRGDPWITRIARLPAIRDKVVLHVMDALIAGYAGGPSFKPKYSWPQATLYFSRDPVAIDAVCLELIDRKRVAAKITAVGERAVHLRTAAGVGLGVADRDRISLQTLQP